MLTDGQFRHYRTFGFVVLRNQFTAPRWPPCAQSMSRNSTLYTPTSRSPARSATGP